jgi:hypothetical protein
MADKKTLKRTFETELRSLPIELVPPDPGPSTHARKFSPAAELEIHPFGVESERGVVDKLIDRIKRL